MIHFLKHELKESEKELLLAESYFDALVKKYTNARIVGIEDEDLRKLVSKEKSKKGLIVSAQICWTKKKIEFIKKVLDELNKNDGSLSEDFLEELEELIEDEKDKVTGYTSLFTLSTRSHMSALHSKAKPNPYGENASLEEIEEFADEHEENVLSTAYDLHFLASMIFLYEEVFRAFK